MEIEAWGDAGKALFILRYPDKLHNDPWNSEWMYALERTVASRSTSREMAVKLKDSSPKTLMRSRNNNSFL